MASNLFIPPSKKHIKEKNKGGIKNLGATCYANATLQALFPVQDDLKFSDESAIARHIKKNIWENISLGHTVSFEIMEEFYKLFNQNQQEEWNYYTQQDAQEFINKLFTGHYDENNQCYKGCVYSKEEEEDNARTVNVSTYIRLDTGVDLCEPIKIIKEKVENNKQFFLLLTVPERDIHTKAIALSSLMKKNQKEPSIYQSYYDLSKYFEHLGQKALTKEEKEEYIVHLNYWLNNHEGHAVGYTQMSNMGQTYIQTLFKNRNLLFSNDTWFYNKTFKYNNEKIPEIYLEGRSIDIHIAIHSYLAIMVNLFEFQREYTNTEKIKKMILPDPLIKRLNENKETVIYRLVSIVLHKGSLSMGHYIAYRETINPRWAKFNDDEVTPYACVREAIKAISEDTAFIPYFFFYKRCKDPTTEELEKTIPTEPVKTTIQPKEKRKQIKEFWERKIKESTKFIRDLTKEGKPSDQNTINQNRLSTPQPIQRTKGNEYSPFPEYLPMNNERQQRTNPNNKALLSQNETTTSTDEISTLSPPTIATSIVQTVLTILAVFAFWGSFIALARLTRKKKKR